MTDEVITQAALGRELGLSRSRINRLIAKGMPARPDGKLNRAEALEFHRLNCSPHGGGWAGLQGDKRRAKLKSQAAESGSGLLELDAEHHPSIVNLLALMTSAANTAQVAGFALKAGCAPREAFLVAVFVRVWVSTIYGPETGDLVWLPEPAEPNWPALLSKPGAPVTEKQIEKWQAEISKMAKAAG